MIPGFEQWGRYEIDPARFFPSKKNTAILAKSNRKAASQVAAVVAHHPETDGTLLFSTSDVEIMGDE